MSDWLGDIFYEVLPEKDYDIRDEQIFMSYQIVKSLKEKNTLFAEAGVGTGKTIAYLLPAIAYARYTGKPVLVACADETLINQLVKEGGDIDRIQQALNLEMDVRLAKSRNQYLCLKRLEEAEQTSPEEFVFDIKNSLPPYVNGNQVLSSTTPYGDRSSFSDIEDAQWSKVNFNAVQQCNVCDLRNRCGQTLHRNFYRESSDLIICSQDFLMEHLWTKESRKRQGQLPLLPEVSMMILDEGHLLEFAAQKALTYEVQETTILNLLERVMVDDIREKTLLLMEHLIEQHIAFFDLLKESSEGVELERKKINKNEKLLSLGKKIIRTVDDLLEEFVFEAELYAIPEYDLRMAEEYLEQYSFSLNLFIENGDAIDWLQTGDEFETLTIMPRLVTDILNEKLFSLKLPIIFSSATLSVNGDFSYLATSLGIESHQSFSVPSPFDYEEVMSIYAHHAGSEKNQTVERLLQKQEQSLLLFKSKYDMLQFKQFAETNGLQGIAFEGIRELSTLIKEFQNGEYQTLCSYHLWEGLDLPGEALTRVIIFDLPFPPNDPIFEARRKFAEDSFHDVDLPYMLLRLQQGIGRLIRTANDRGSIHLILNDFEMELQKRWEDILPVTISHEKSSVK
ncbi:ATP-dependent DNA helicase [Chungangia koreensis]|uniref:ATP-dependent DNA helicase n=1 Tax=Chungangia koreensis TaxID=752657 RepID=A0ABV8X6Z0_9LACT